MIQPLPPCLSLFPSCTGKKKFQVPTTTKDKFHSRKEQDQDGFLYLVYASQETFGWDQPSRRNLQLVTFNPDQKPGASHKVPNLLSVCRKPRQSSKDLSLIVFSLAIFILYVRTCIIRLCILTKVMQINWIFTLNHFNKLPASRKRRRL